MIFCDLSPNNSKNNGSNLPDTIDPGSIGNADSSSLKILFIGNSLTYYNSQPHLFWNMANSVGKNLYVDQATIPGAQLLDHLESDSTKAKIASQKWDIVILQEAVDEIAFPENHGIVKHYIQSVKDLILENNAATKIFYFLPWSVKSEININLKNYSFEEFQKLLRDGTVQIANQMNIKVAPVGWAWYKVIQDRPEIELYALDGAHPSFSGSYLNACVYFVMIFRESAVDNPFSVLISQNIANYLQETATKTVMDSLEYWNIQPIEIFKAED